MSDQTKGRAKFEKLPGQLDLIDFIAERDKRKPKEREPFVNDEPCTGYASGTCCCQACCDRQDAEIDEWCKENGFE